MTIFWIHANSPTRFRQGYRNIADKLMLPGREDGKADVLQIVYNWLVRQAKWAMADDT